MTKITKAVFPVAGFGSRFLPATKAQPKEMLPIVDKPLIQYAVEEAVSAGINELISLQAGTNGRLKIILTRPMNWKRNLRRQANSSCLNISRKFCRKMSIAFIFGKSSRLDWDMPYYVHGLSSEMNPLPFCWPMIS